MAVDTLTESATATLIAVAWKVAGALLLWLVGRWLIAFALRFVGRALANQRIDATLSRYLINNVVDHRQAIQLLKERVARIPNVLSAPAPAVEILQFTPAGPLLCVRPYSSNEHSWQVYFDTNRLIREAFGEAGYPAPVPGYAVTGPLASPPLDVIGR